MHRGSVKDSDFGWLKTATPFFLNTRRERVDMDVSTDSNMPEISTTCCMRFLRSQIGMPFIALQIYKEEIASWSLWARASKTTQSAIIVEDDRNPEHPAPPAASLYRPVTGLKGKVQSMRGELVMMVALSQDLQESGGLEGRYKIWAEQMSLIHQETESVINAYDALNNLSIVTRYVSISRRVDRIRNKIEDALTRRRQTDGLVKFHTRAGWSLPMISRGRTRPSIVAKESNVVGFDEDVQVLMALLLSDEEHRSVTPIVGIAGTGKSALAMLLFEARAVKDHFDCRVWVTIPSSNYTPQQLLQEVVYKAAERIMVAGDLADRQKIQEGSSSWAEVLKILATKKYLLVLDGVQTSLDALNLEETIPDMSTGSRILLTSRNANVATLHSTSSTATIVHPLQLLDDASSLVLFERISKLDLGKVLPELKEIAEKIVIKCGGLPSEILKIASLLSHKDVTKEEWSRVLEDQQPWSETLNTINMNLLSYLKKCLFSFALFPADFEIPVRRLVVLWVAESLVHQGDDKEPPEQVAERYLTELIDLNMIQIAKRKKRNGKVKTCRLPHALRQHWLTTAIQSRFLHGQVATDAVPEPNNSIIRRVADHFDENNIWHRHIHGDTATASASLQASAYYKDVLSFLSFDTRDGSKPGHEIGNFLNICISKGCFLALRVLDLEAIYKPMLPENMSRLSRLRYLGLRRTYLESLPSSISSLLTLQTLDLKHTYIKSLPPSIWKMQLRHLFLSETYRTRFPPKPSSGESLSDLQTLWGLFVDEETPVKGGLDKLVNIRKLGLACQSVSLGEDAMKTQLEAVAHWIVKLEYLQSLRLKSRNEEGHPCYLPQMSLKNHKNLTDIYLLGSLSSPNILSSLPLNLVELTLSHSKLVDVDDPMKILKNFPNLQSLCLLADSYKGKVLVCESQSFPQLQVLKFWMLEQLEEWKIEEGALPNLRQLEIRSCGSLKMLPDGLVEVKTLLELKLTNMPAEINHHRHMIPPNCEVFQDNYN